MTSWIIFRKELMDTLRDKRTIFVMIILPIILMPALLLIVGKVQQFQEEKAHEKKLRFVWIENGNAENILDSLQNRSDFRLITDVEIDSLESFIQNDSLDIALFPSSNYDELLKIEKQASIKIMYKSTESMNIAREKIDDVLDYYSSKIVSERIAKLELDPHIFEPISVEEKDVATIKEKLGKAIGGLIPYFFVLFCFLGGMYPAIDLGAGEKERGSLETLLSSPANRRDILIGKLGVVICSGLLSAVISLGGLFITLYIAKDFVPEQILNSLLNLVNARMLGLIFLLILPLNIFFGALLLCISIFAKSFKEAQSIANPFLTALIIPMYIGILPGVELTTFTAIMPVLNVTLATKEIVAGTMDNFLLIIVIMSQILLAFGALWFTRIWFEREETLFRST